MLTPMQARRPHATHLPRAYGLNILCDGKLSWYYILWLAPLMNGYEFHLYYNI